MREKIIIKIILLAVITSREEKKDMTGWQPQEHWATGNDLCFNLVGVYMVFAL